MYYKLKQHKKIGVALTILFCFVILALIAAVLDKKWSLHGIHQDKFSSEDDENINNVLTFDDVDYQYSNDMETFLIMGTDYSGNEEGKGKDYEGSMSDFLLLMIIDHTENTYAFLPLDRNTIVNVSLIDEEGKGAATAQEQLCTAHSYGGTKEMGCQNTSKAISEYLGGLSIDGYYSISLSQIPALNHALGGVEVVLKDDFSSLDPEMTKGKKLTLSDSQAEIFLHSRMKMEDDSNVNRMERQSAYMKAALKKGKINLKNNPNYIKNNKDTFEGVATSTITNKQISRIANALIKYEDKGEFSIKGKTKMGGILEDGEEHEEFYPDSDSVLSIMTELYHLEEVEE